MIAVYLLAWRAGRAATGFGILAAPRAPSKSVADAWRSFSTAADSARPDGAASATEQEASAALDSIAKQRRILTDMRHPAQWYAAIATAIYAPLRAVACCARFASHPFVPLYISAHWPAAKRIASARKCAHLHSLCVPDDCVPLFSHTGTRLPGRCEERSSPT